jgi:signal transduction histidine kinase
MKRPALALRGRIFLASAFVAVVSLAAALQLVTRRVSDQAEAELRHGLERATRLAVEEHASRLDTLAVQARLLADLPTLKAALATGDPPTVTALAADLRARARADVIGVAGARGEPLAWVGDDPALRPARGPEPPAGTGGEGPVFLVAPDAVLQVVTVPILVGPDPPERLGALSLGVRLDAARARQFEAVTDARVAFALGGLILASSLPAGAHAALEALPATPQPGALSVDGEEYVVARRALTADPAGPVAFILLSRSERLAVLRSFRTALLGAAIVAVALALGLSWAVARTVSRPLAQLTAVMREMAATGDLARRIERPSGWSDEDAAVVATSFSALTGAIARFQREAASRERLSALGRLSAVIAHEVRNPLMIIKSSLASLRSAGLDAERIREAAADIDHEVARLSRLVDGVLDYARPPRLEYAPVALVELCRDALQAALGGEPAVRGELRAEAAPAEIVTDGERLRGVLVNVLVNARDAVLARSASGETPDAGTPDVVLRVSPETDGRVAIAVEDRGTGLTAEQAARVFDPYFTTKRAGTGLGLAIARNVTEALGGTIAIENREGRGTSVRLAIPVRPPEGA